MNIATSDAQSFKLLLIFVKTKFLAMIYHTCDIIPCLVLESLTYGHDLLLIFVIGLRDINYGTVVFIHVFDAFIILKIPHFYVALRYCY
jgi:hypothetical protein